MRTFARAFRFQLQLLRRTPDALQVCCTAPLLAVIFLAVTEHAGRPDLAPVGVVAPTLMSLWLVVLLAAGQIITDERNLGTLEAMVATPARLAVVVFGRLVAVATVGVVAFAEAWLVAGLVFDRWLVVPHVAVVVGAGTLAALATAGTASVLSPLFVLLPSARILQNSLTYPFYLLGGVAVPVSAYPEWLQPLSRLVFLSWAADLLRDGFSAEPVRFAAVRMAMVALLGLIGFAIGAALLARVLVRVRRDGTLAHT